MGVTEPVGKPTARYLQTPDPCLPRPPAGTGLARPSGWPPHLLSWLSEEPSLPFSLSSNTTHPPGLSPGVTFSR